MSPKMRHLTLASIVLGVVVAAAEQIAPMAPILPTSLEQCSAFGREVDKYFDRVNKEHEQCLKDNKAANSDEKAGYGQPKCTRPACQYLHDQLYGDSPFGFTRKERQQAVSKCFNDVREYLDREAKKKQAEAESNSKREAEQQEKGKQQADRAAADKAKQDLARRQRQTAEENRRRAAERQEQLESESRRKQAQEEQARRESELQQRQAEERQKAAEEKRKAEEKQKAQEAIAALRDPLEQAQKQRDAMKLKPQEPGLHEPFSSANRPNAEMLKPSEDQERSKLALGSFDQLNEGMLDNIDASVKLAESQVSKSQLSKKAFMNFKAGADDTKSVCKGLTHVVRGLEYGAVLKDIYEANEAGDVQRTKYKEQELMLEIGKDTVVEWAKNAARQGVAKVIVQLFPKVAPYVASRAITAAGAGVSTFFYSSDIGVEHEQVIFDTSGQYSLEDKQKALFQRWKLYDHNPSAWYPDDLKTLIKETDTVYRDAAPKRTTGPGRIP